MADRLDKIEDKLHEIICVLAKLEGFLMHRRCSCKCNKKSHQKTDISSTFTSLNTGKSLWETFNEEYGKDNK